MVNYDMLLRDSTLDRTKNDDPAVSREEMVKEFTKLTGNQGMLSSFIDPEFINQCTAPVQSINLKAMKNLSPLSEFVDKVQDKNYLGELTKNKKKKGQDNLKYLILSPCLSLLLHFSNMLVSDLWESRQAAACGLSSLLNTINSQINSKNSSLLPYKVVSHTESGYQIHSSDTVELDEILRGLLCKSIILILKDQFCDYEDVNVLTPVRSQCMLLIQRIC